MRKSRIKLQDLFLFIALMLVVTMDDLSFDADVRVLSMAREYDVKQQTQEQALQLTAGVACCADDALIAELELADRMERSR